jgi:hypothetical protein
VVGFDPFNEPLVSWKGVMDALFEVFPHNMDKYELTPLYERLMKKY